MAAFDPQARIAILERELAWAHLKIQSLTEELRQQRVKMLGPRSETLSDLQLQLLVEEEPSTSRDEVEAEPTGPRQRMYLRGDGSDIPDGSVSRRTCLVLRK